MITKYQIIYWRDIPAQVRAKAGRERKSEPLSKRFGVAIDEAAMRAGLTGSEDYLAQWRQSDWQDHDGQPVEVVKAKAAELEAGYPSDRLRKLVEQFGLEEGME
jgi:hypothetical protein